LKRVAPLNALKAFAVAAQEGSFTRAGQALHVTQGAISRQVKQLESAMGVTLFSRVHQRVELTPAGQELATSLQRLFAEMDMAVRKARGQDLQHMLRLNVPPTFATRWLAPRLSDFRARFPNIDLSITTDRLQGVREARSVDCLIMFGRAPWPQTPSQPVLQERHIMVSSPALWHGDQPPPLPGATLLHILDGDQRLPVWEQWIARHGPRELDARPGLNFSTLDQAISAALAGAGVVVVDEAMIVPELKSGALRRHHALFVDGPHGYWFVKSAQPAIAQAQVAEFEQWLMQHALSASALPD